GNFLAQLARVDLQGLGKRRRLALAELEVLGARPDRFHGRGDRERLAIAVLHGSAGGRHVEHAPVAPLALGLKEAGVHALQVEAAPGDDGEARGDQREHEARAPALELQAQLRRALEEFHGVAPGTVTTTVVAASGRRMPRLFEATASTRLLV